MTKNKENEISILCFKALLFCCLGEKYSISVIILFPLDAIEFLAGFDGEFL